MGNTARRETHGSLGLSRELSVLREEEVNFEPWLGGSCGYPLWYRIEAMQTDCLGMAEEANHTLQHDWRERAVVYYWKGPALALRLVPLCCRGRRGGDIYFQQWW
eukprot:scaffold130540_cov67-Attheya_sp.AAC.2